MIRLVAHAKVNLFLEITGRRSDGYHTLDTLFQTISLGDTLSFALSPTLSLTCTDKSLPVDERNLVMRAALVLREALKEKRGAKIALTKVVPMGAGLGGGSADAAATLKGLLRLWNRRISGPILKRIAVQLGADVPFFLKGGTASATGIGDQLKPLKALPVTWMVIVWPGFGVATKEAYAKVKLPFKDPRVRLPGDPRLHLYNRFESLVFPDHPPLPKLKQEFLDAGAMSALMSGSGSAVFGIGRSRAHASRIFAAIRKKYRHAWLARSC